jgi:hypothetical protein
MEVAVIVKSDDLRRAAMALSDSAEHAPHAVHLNDGIAVR